MQARNEAFVRITFWQREDLIDNRRVNVPLVLNYWILVLEDDASQLLFIFIRSKSRTELK